MAKTRLFLIILTLATFSVILFQSQFAVQGGNTVEIQKFQFRSLFKKEFRKETIPTFFKKEFKKENIPIAVAGIATSWIPGGWVALSAAVALWKRKYGQKPVQLATQATEKPTQEKPN